MYQDLPIEEYAASLTAMGLPLYVVHHFSGAMLDYQHGHMAGADNNIEKLTGQKPMTVGEFAHVHLAQLNPKKTA